MKLVSDGHNRKDPNEGDRDSFLTDHELVLSSSVKPSLGPEPGDRKFRRTDAERGPPKPPGDEGQVGVTEDMHFLCGCQRS